MQKIAGLFCSSLVALALSACAGTYIDSKPVADWKDSKDFVSGYYALPRMLVKLTVSYGPKKAPADAETAPPAAPIASMGAKVKKKPKKAPAKPTVAKEVTVEFGTPIYVPDAAYRYVVKLDHEIWSDDHLKIDTDAGGLLKGVNADSEDERGAAIVKVVELASAIAQDVAALGGSMFMSIEAEAKPLNCKGNLKTDFKFEIVFDPTDVRQVKALQKQLCDRGVAFDAWQIGDQIGPADRSGTGSILSPELRDLLNTPLTDDKSKGTKAPPAAATPAAAPSAGTTDCSHAICFRPAMPYNIAVDDRRFLIIAPDRSKTLRFDLSRIAFRKANATLIFESGMLTSADSTKPSELIGALQVPIDAAKAIAEIPGKLLTLQVNNATSAAGLAEQQDALLKTQAQMIADLKALNDAKAAKAGTPASP